MQLVDPSLIEELLSFGEVRSLAPGEVLCAQGEASETAFVVVEGSLETVVETDGASVVLGSHPPGALVGEVTALVGGQRSATLRAAGDASVSVIAKQHLQTIFDRYPAEAARVSAVARDRTDRSRVAMLLAEELGTTDQQAIATIAGLVTWRRLTAGETLFEAGAPADAAYLVLSGRLNITSPTGQVVAQVRRGAIVGEFGLLESRSRTATVTALRDSALARLSGADFAAINASHTALAMGLVRRIIDRSGRELADDGQVGRSACIVTTSAIDAERVVGGIVAPLTKLGSTIHLNPAEIDRLLGAPDASEIDIGDIGHARLAELLYQADADHDHVVLESHIDKPKWTGTAIGRADQVVVVCSANPIGNEERELRQILSAVPETTPVWLALVHPPGAERAFGTAALRTRFGVDEIHHVFQATGDASKGASKSGADCDAADLARVGRLAVGKGFALVLSGGGARGFAHIGVLAALEDHGVPVDRFAGASMGAVMAAGFAQGVKRDDRVSVTDERFHKLLDYTVPIVSLLKAKRMSASLAAQWGEYDIEDLHRPFSCVATNLTTAEVVHLRRGSALTAIRASTAIPGVVPPVPHNGDLLVDGGVLDNLPVDLVDADPSIGTIIAVDVAPPDGPSTPSDYGLSVSGLAALRDKFSRKTSKYPPLSAVLMRTMLIGSDRDRTRVMASDAVDFYIDLELPGIALLDFKAAKKASDRGYEGSYERVGKWWAERQAAQAAQTESVTRDR